LWGLVGIICNFWWRRGELNPSPKIARTMNLHV